MCHRKLLVWLFAMFAAGSTKKNRKKGVGGMGGGETQSQPLGKVENFFFFFFLENFFPGQDAPAPRPPAPAREGLAAAPAPRGSPLPLRSPPPPGPARTHPWRGGQSPRRSAAAGAERGGAERSGVRRPERGRAAPRRFSPASRPGSLGLVVALPAPRRAGG